MVQTPNIKLEKPVEGTRPWTTAVNGNWDKIDTAVGNINKELQALSVNSVNVSLSNVSSAGKQTSVDWGMPNYAAGISATSPYTAPKAGFIISLRDISAVRSGRLTINGIEIYTTQPTRAGGRAGDLGGYIAGFCYPVAEGDVVSWTNFYKMTFYPNKGA